jgi:hypothetical protein
MYGMPLHRERTTEEEKAFTVVFKNTVWPDRICMRVVPLVGPEKDINGYRFLTFYF